MADEFDTGESGSILGSLKARREAIVKRTVLSVAVPRWENPEIVIKYKPVEHKIIRRALTLVEKAPTPQKAEAEVNGNCDVLIAGCIAVVARIDDKEYSLKPGDPHGEPTLFDADLAENLGLDEPGAITARKIVRALFFTEGDILGHAGQIIDFSGYRESTADEEFEGE